MKTRRNPNEPADLPKNNSQVYKSTAKSDKNRFFHNVKSTNDGVTQNVNVSVNVDQKDDCITSCFSGLAKCFGK